jgi:hypothetical protein
LNLSLCDRFRPFANRLSAWARALDWLAYKYGILFIVSAGNVGQLNIAAAADADAYAALGVADRIGATLGGVRDALPTNAILSPAEAVNAVTVGALHSDTIGAAADIGLYNHDPLPAQGLPSPVSRLGPGFLRAVKPDILAAGGRLRGSSHPTSRPATLRFNGATRFGGLRVAAADGQGTAWSGATSAAAAVTSRTAHLIHDAIEEAYGTRFTGLPRPRRALIVKALLVHRASIHPDARAAVEQIFGPVGHRLAAQRQKNIERVFGYGIVQQDEALACAYNRATLWGSGELAEDQAQVFDLPIPTAILANRDMRSITATLAWFSPVVPGRRAYRSVRLQIEEPGDIGTLGVRPQAGQTPRRSSERGTTFQRCWSGTRIPRDRFTGNSIQFAVSRRPDTDDHAPDVVPFAVVVTVESANDHVRVYDQVIARLAIAPRARVRA